MAVIKDGSSGKVAKVTKELQLSTVAENHELQHHNSWVDHQTFQVLAVDTGITATTQSIMHITNNDSTRKLVVSSLHIEAITNSSLPDVGEYFELGYGTTYSSGGAVVEPVNMNAGSGVVAAVTVYGTDPTSTGTFTPFERDYHKESAEIWSVDEHDSIILGLGESLDVRFTSIGTGEAMCRLAFMMIRNDR